MIWWKVINFLDLKLNPSPVVITLTHGDIVRSSLPHNITRLLCMLQCAKLHRRCYMRGHRVWRIEICYGGNSQNFIHFFAQLALPRTSCGAFVFWLSVLPRTSCTTLINFSYTPHTSCLLCKWMQMTLQAWHESPVQIIWSK